LQEEEKSETVYCRSGFAFKGHLSVIRWFDFSVGYSERQPTCTPIQETYIKGEELIVHSFKIE